MELIKENHIFMNQTMTEQTEVLHFLSKKAVELGFTADDEQVYQKFAERETEGTTGMMDGFAIPHAKSNSITKAEILIVCLEKGIDWKSMDGEPTNFIIALFIPDSEAGTTHLKLLSTVARLLMRKEVTEGLKNASSAKEIAALLNGKLQEN